MIRVVFSPSRATAGRTSAPETTVCDMPTMASAQPVVLGSKPCFRPGPDERRELLFEAMNFRARGDPIRAERADDLSDLVAARQWFMRLGAKEWEAAVNLHIGEKAMSAVNADPMALQSMAQVSVWHFYKARDYYFERRETKMVDRIQFDIERATQLLTSYTQGVSQIEAARITAKSTIQHGEDVRKGLESLGQGVHYGLAALGEHIEQSGGSLSRALQATSASLSANITNAMYTLAASSRFRGRSLDKRMSDVGQLISTTAREVPEGFFQPVKELGVKFALGAVSSAASSDITSEPPIVNMTETVMPEVKKTEETMKQLDEPTIRLTGTLLDTLVSKGMSKVVEQMHETEASHK